jgi:lipoprotein NlpI
MSRENRPGIVRTRSAMLSLCCRFRANTIRLFEFDPPTPAGVKLMRWLGTLALIVCGSTLQAADETPLKKAEEAYGKKDYKAAAELAAEAAKMNPKSAQAPFIVGMSRLSLREFPAAIDAFTAVLKINPKLAAANDRRGDAYLKQGKFAEAIADFDVFLAANPKFGPEHWRRGIALYYAKRYEDGVKQFDTHKTVNPEDVENAVWHYLCNIKGVGKEKAQKSLIDVTKDTRVPMAEIQKLYAGKLKPEDVLAASEKTKADSPEGTSARFYGHLYVALWYEAEGDAKKVREHLTAAVEKYKIGDYMWDVGNAHLQMLKAMK